MHTCGRADVKRICRALTASLVFGLLLIASIDAESAGTRIISTPSGFGRVGDNMGAAVAIFGDTAVAGSPDAWPAPTTNSGVAQVFRNDGTGWHLEAVLVPSDATVGQGFGSGVAVGQDIAVVGDAGFGSANSYTFVRNGSQWTQTDELAFGNQPSLSGDTLVLNNGSVARVYVRANGAWIQQADLQGDLSPDQGEFVSGAVVSGDYATITTFVQTSRAPSQDVYAISEYFFSRSNGAWTRETKLDRGTSLLGPAGPVVAMSDTTAILAGGDVEAYVRDNGVWTLQGQLDPGTSWNFSVTPGVTVDGDTAVIGMPADTVLGLYQAGSAYVFTRSGTAWTRTARPYDPNGAPNAFFGSAVSLSGNSLVVGAPGAAMDDVSSGKMDAFDLAGDPATPVASLGEGNAHAGETFGEALAASETKLLVAASGATNENSSTTGAAYLLEQDGGSWVQRAVFRTAGSYARFASAVALDGTTAVVGSDNDNIGDPNDVSAAYVYVESGGTWQEQQRIGSGLAYPGFGDSLGLVGDMLVVGNPGWSNQQLRGNVRIFTRAGTIWSEQGTIQPTESSDGDEFGQVLAMSADTMIIGAPGVTVGIESNAGAAYVFAWNGSAWQEEAQLLAPMPLEYTRFGQSVALAGDTVIVGATNQQTSSGSGAYVFTRAGATWALQATLTRPPDSPPTFGSAVAVSSDASIAVVGALVQSAPGTAYAFLRTGTDWSLLETLHGSQFQYPPADYFGESALFSGSTVFIGAPGEFVGGAVYAVPLSDPVFANGFD